jgi:hypothetical protein
MKNISRATLQDNDGVLASRYVLFESSSGKIILTNLALLYQPGPRPLRDSFHICQESKITALLSLWKMLKFLLHRNFTTYPFQILITFTISSSSYNVENKPESKSIPKYMVDYIYWVDRIYSG